MDDLKHQFKENFLRYASYVILDRAIPNAIDGLKPVQRRILWTLFRIDDSKLHKVANVAGQTMALHPHGDAPIVDALVNLASKGYLLDTQGNFGNPLTGDPPAAARYIETRLGKLAKETLFNPDLTPFVSSYDGRNQEPVSLPAKIPLLLLQGSEGIAVGMATRILPHNFCELLEAEIALLEGKPFTLLPDFPSGGTMDATDYDDGRGKVKLRAKISIADDKTLNINEICFGTTTESLIRSIDEAAKKGKIKIDAINDYTAEHVAIEIKLPRGQYAKNTIDALYAFTDCEVTLHSQMVVIKENYPWETTASELLKFHAEQLKGYLKQELEIERARLLETIFQKTLEQLFIENRLYKRLEQVASYEKIHETVAASLVPFHQELSRIPTEEDRERLLKIPIRRISRFDIEKNQEEIAACLRRLAEIDKELSNIKRFTIRYLQGLLKKYRSLFPRRTRLGEIEEIDRREMSRRTLKVGYDPKSGFLGTKVTGDSSIECTNLDRLILFYASGVYQVINVPEKHYVHTEKGAVVFIGIVDKKTPIQVIYQDKKNHFPYAKRFIVKQFILDKPYRFLEEEHKLEYLSSRPSDTVELHFKPKPRQKAGSLKIAMEEVAIKGVGARGIRIANKELRKIKVIEEK